MTEGPQFRGQVHVQSGTVEAFFVSKTLADKAVNDWNATIGEGRTLYAVRKIFPDE